MCYAGCYRPSTQKIYLFFLMTDKLNLKRPQTTVVLAMTADGKISDVGRHHATFGTAVDKAHLEHQVAISDAVLFGNSTLKSEKSAFLIKNNELITEREAQNQPKQPIQIICSGTGVIDPQWRFFQQPISRWLLTTKQGANTWNNQPGFEKILVCETPTGNIDFTQALTEMAKAGIEKLGVLGGGKLVASLIAENLIDKLWLTVCPLIFGGENAPTPVDGKGFSNKLAPRLKLLETRIVGDEIFLHYKVERN